MNFSGNIIMGQGTNYSFLVTIRLPEDFDNSFSRDRSQRTLDHLLPRHEETFGGGLRSLSAFPFYLFI